MNELTKRKIHNDIVRPAARLTLCCIFPIILSLKPLPDNPIYLLEMALLWIVSFGMYFVIATPSRVFGPAKVIDAYREGQR